MSNAPEAIAGDVFDSIEGARHHGRHARVSGFGDLIGTSIEDRIKAEVARQAAAQIIESAKDALTSGLGWGLNFNPLHALKSAVKLSARPFTYQANLANRLLHKASHVRLPGEGGGGGRRGGGGGGGGGGDGGGGGGGDDGSAPDGGGGDQQQDDATEGLMGALQSPGAASRISYLEGISPGFTARLAAHLRQRRGQGGAPPGWRARAQAAAAPAAPAASAGFSLSSLFHHAKPAGKLLVSATPGGTTALQAHAIATKALKSGALKPDHLKKAGALTKAGRKGDDKALVKMARIKAAAAKGDPNAILALDRLRLANCLQTGGRCQGGAPGGRLSQSYSQGLAALAHRHA